MLHGGKDKRLSDKYFHNQPARPFPHLYLSESPTRKAMAQSDWWDVSSNARKMFSNGQMFLTNPEFLSTHNAGVRVKLLISVKSDIVGCIAFDKKKQFKNLYRKIY